MTFTKRKFGLFKKAYELSKLCDSDIAVVILNNKNKLFTFSSTDTVDDMILKYNNCKRAHEKRSNKDMQKVFIQ